MRPPGAAAPPPTARSRRPDPLALVIFGASGDLTSRKLMPAVYRLFRAGLLPERFAVLGYSRTPMTDDQFRGRMRSAVESAWPGGGEGGPGPGEAGRGGLGGEEAWAAFASRLHYQAGGYDDPEGYRTLARRLKDLGGPSGVRPNRLFYLATPPSVFAEAAEGLAAAGLAKEGPAEGRPPAAWSHLVVEKPFGEDLASARSLGRRLRAAFAEHQIFRIDHYLGKEAVQNILVLRFANAVFEPLWNSKYVDHIQITVAETLGVEGRGPYYDRAGALRDIVQNHMMHLVSLVAMEPPHALAPDAVRDAKVQVLRSLRPVPPECVPQGVVRAQYGRGTVDGRQVPGYREEPGVAPGSTTETFAAFKAFVDNWRWSGVPFYLRTGKRLPVQATEIGVHFRPIPAVLFNADPARPLRENVLSIRIQPDEGISMRFQVKVPGLAMRIEPFEMRFGYAGAFGAEPPEAYERLLLDAAFGDATLFTRSDEVEAAWAFVDPILRACAERPAGRLPEYPAGSWGPDAADALLRADGRAWTTLAPRARRREGDGPCEP